MSRGTSFGKAFGKRDDGFPKKLNCLDCDKEFVSQHRFNKMCNSCRFREIRPQYDYSPNPVGRPRV